MSTSNEWFVVAKCSAAATGHLDDQQNSLQIMGRLAVELARLRPVVIAAYLKARTVQWGSLFTNQRSDLVGSVNST